LTPKWGGEGKKGYLSIHDLSLIGKGGKGEPGIRGERGGGGKLISHGDTRVYQPKKKKKRDTLLDMAGRKTSLPEEKRVIAHKEEGSPYAVRPGKETARSQQAEN